MRKVVSQPKIIRTETEAEIMRVIKDYLQILENKGKLMFIRIQSGGYPTKEGQYIKMSRKGSPDILVFAQKYFAGDDYYFEYLKTIALEVKTAKGKQSLSQKEWQEKFENLGGKYYIVRSIEDLWAILENLSLIRIRSTR